MSFMRASVSAKRKRKNAPISGDVSPLRTISSAVLKTDVALFSLPSLAYSYASSSDAVMNSRSLG
jgi:hypothetical protein